jgi:hypothetical protein
MADYSNPNTRLTASKYAWEITFRGPVRNGIFQTQRVRGNYDTRPDDTVGSFLTSSIAWYSKVSKIPREDVAIASYSLREE